MRITFLGHAAFLIESEQKQIITDPYSREIGYLPINQRTDFVTLSHDNPKWHSCLDDIQGNFEVINGLEIMESGAVRDEISFNSVLAYERENEGENAMVCIEIEGIRVLHTGDCGVLPHDETLKRCGRVDVLLALAGGFPTLNLDDLMILIEKLAPKIVIPMHFSVPNLQMEALGVEEIEKRFQAEQIVRHAESSLHFLWKTLPQHTQLHVLKPLRTKNESRD
ncbi:L-ascorbate metabolism protein UlaG, beta-lactamase superfamily [Abditibacterium utsteinense]|uniref:L-ascorbate metabolism protein UlaG, beta-lactamase superfamily n=1 Tax=Abditibacterium utsteinense TaxID=1960156 RepID=A0A2S8SP48_9BACT|nr:MBL fold metallo-hydrolase [Abditibacterium utsteinense]PQV62568.1 L-ascorbate metabolism protein UlaG, beta-lactamase superfamily [Abditibacterium utsteinense]